MCLRAVKRNINIIKNTIISKLYSAKVGRRQRDVLWFQVASVNQAKMHHRHELWTFIQRILSLKKIAKKSRNKERKYITIPKQSHSLHIGVLQQSSSFTTSVSPISHRGGFVRGHLTGLHFTLMVSLSHTHSEQLLFQVSPTCSSDGATLAPPETHPGDD